MKYKLLNNCERGIQEYLPDVIRFNLHPNDELIVTEEEYKAICLARGLRGMADFVVTPIPEDKEVAAALKTTSNNKFIAASVKKEDLV